MPTYSFTCRACGNKFEVNVPWAKKKETRCPACGSSDLKEKFSLNVFGAPTADAWSAGSGSGGSCGTGGSRFG